MRVTETELIVSYIFFKVLMGRMWLRINLSRIFAKKDKWQMGRWNVNKSGGLFGFKTRTIVENFQRSRK